MQSKSGARSHAYYAGIAAYPGMKAQHGNPLWLPWLRTAAYAYEEGLRGCGFDALPFWDFTVSADTGALPRIFVADPDGGENPLASALLPELPPKSLGDLPTERTVRGPDSPWAMLPTASNVSAPAERISETYTSRLEHASPATAPLGQRVAFKREEAEASRDRSTFLRPNPRHVKRLINVYRLVRSLPESRARDSGDPDARIVIDNPQATVRWLVISAQWPYTAQAMLATGRRLETDGKKIREPALQTLYRGAQPHLSEEKQNEFDDDADRLASLLKETQMSWDQLRAIRRYTINFNPAVEHQLRLERGRTAQRKPRASNGRRASRQPGSAATSQQAAADAVDQPVAE